MIQENPSTRTRPAVVAQTGRLRITFVFSTYASQLNAFEAHVRTIHRWAFTGSNFIDGNEAEETLRLLVRRLKGIPCGTKSRPADQWECSP
jgi:hypothetical protein